MITYHVMLTFFTEHRETIDLTPGRDLSYPDARKIMLDIGRLYDQALHGPGAVSYLEVIPMRWPR
jgi:hypothetical protein